MASAQMPAFKILVFSATAGYRHASISNGIALIRELSATNNFAVDTTEDATLFTDTNLAKYQAIVFLLTTGDVLTNAQQMGALVRYVEAGGGWVGIHSASDTLHTWAWYGSLVGAYFVSHPSIQPATVRVEDHIDVSTSMLPAAWVRTDEWYNFDHNPRGAVHVLATVDETTYSGGTMGADHPIAWCHYYDGGRAWYTAGGHTAAAYSEPLFPAHLLGGILFAAGAAPGHPPLNVSPARASLLLSWPAGASGFVPATATNLQPGAIWTPITNTPVFQNGMQTLVIPSTRASQFFRLAK
jgi:type 1 glutamine amidotransferase